MTWRAHGRLSAKTLQFKRRPVSTLYAHPRCGAIRVPAMAVPGNPIEDIGLMKKVSFVIKDGTVYKVDGIAVPRAP